MTNLIIKIDNTKWNGETYQHDLLKVIAGDHVALTSISRTRGADTYGFSGSQMVHDDGVWCNDTCHRYLGMYEVTKSSKNSISLKHAGADNLFVRDSDGYKWVKIS